MIRNSRFLPCWTYRQIYMPAWLTHLGTQRTWYHKCPNRKFERVKEVAKGPLLTFEQFVERMNIEIEKLRKKPPRKGEKLTREQLWKIDLQYTLPAPSQQRLIVFANTVKQYRAKVYGRGVYREKAYFVPVTRTLETETLLSELEGQYVPSVRDPNCETLFGEVHELLNHLPICRIIFENGHYLRQDPPA